MRKVCAPAPYVDFAGLARSPVLLLLLKPRSSTHSRATLWPLLSHLMVFV